MTAAPADDMRCLNCGSKHTWRHEVDIGVGIQYGPLHCDDCGWSEESQPLDALIEPEEDELPW